MPISVYSTEDQCEVYLCKTPIRFIDSVGLLFTLKVSLSGRGNSWYKHWAVAFDYGNDLVLICEGGIDHVNKLTGRKCWKRKETFDKFYSDKNFLGTHTVPEARIEKLLKKLCDGGTYHAMRNNCHKWAIRFLVELGIAPPEEHEAEEVVHEVILPGMRLISSALGVIGLVCILVRLHSS